MLKLDRFKPFGTVHPPEIQSGHDRPAAAFQDGKWFDAHDREIVPGQPLSAAMAADDVDENAPDQPMGPAELLAGADSIALALFQREARRILGEACPAAKHDMVRALKKVVGEFGERPRKQRLPRAAPEAPDSDPPDTGEEAKPQVPAKPAKAKAGSVDLAAWARGHKDYLFGDVRKALRQQYSVQIAGANERMDALQFLIANGVVTAAEARADIEDVVAEV